VQARFAATQRSTRGCACELAGTGRALGLDSLRYAGEGTVKLALVAAKVVAGLSTPAPGRMPLYGSRDACRHGELTALRRGGFACFNVRAATELWPFA